MNLMDKIGISYKAGYLVQGNQLERCKTSTSLKVNNTELQIRTDGKDSDISSISKSYKGNIIFHVPAINPDLSNLKFVNELVKKIKDNNVKLISINASNLSSDLFEWSTLDEQKKYFLNIVTSVATLASNKIEVAIENLKLSDANSMFGSNITQITDIIVYSRRLLIRDFGFEEEEAEKYIGLSLNIDNIDLGDESESILNYFEVFNKSIKLVKISNLEKLELVLDYIVDKNYNVPLLLQTSSELEEVKNEYLKLVSIVSKRCSESVPSLEIKENNENKGFSNIIIITMIILTIVIVGLMFFIKIKI
ncbi:MAG: hypothetical protein J6B64_01470 [Bacilli bacterium]|nr:hypothetical protein [Bacilli bacterium]MBP3635475.1 hypothetical protein [Bacilli bacterium]